MAQATIERPLTYLRWTLITALAYMILLGESGLTPAASHLAYVGALLASNLIIPRVPYRNPQKFGSTLLAVDTLFVLIGVLLCDGASQDLLIAYFLCIIMATFADSQRRVAGAAVLVTVVYSFWLFQNLHALSRASLLVRLPFLFITTVFYGYMMERVRGEHRLRLQAEEEIGGLDCLLHVTRLLSSSLVSKEILDRVATIVRASLRVDRCRLELVSPSGSGLHGAALEALARRKPVVRSEAEAVTVLALPVVYDIEPLAVLVVEADHAERSFAAAEIDFCQIVANAAASALKNACQYEALAEADRTKAEFLSNLSHELRTPLNSINGFSELLVGQLEETSDPELREMASRISTNAATLRKHVENLLDLSMATLGGERKELERVDLRQMIHGVVEEAEHADRRNRQLSFAVEIDPTIGELYTDGGKLKRVLENILLNAAKFTRDGSINVRAKLLKRSVSPIDAGLSSTPLPWEQVLSLSVTDTGIGIDAALLAKIFKGFRQGSRGVSRDYGGLGIGLAVAQRLTNLLGGEIRVNSCLDRGSEFEVLVPVQVAA